MNGIALIVLLTIVFDYMLHVSADFLNLKGLQTELPGSFRGLYDPERYRKSQDYLRVNTRFGWITGTFNLATFISYTTPETIRPLLTKAQMDAMNLALNAGVTNKDTIETILGLARGKMLALASQVPDGLDDDLRDMLSAAPPAAAAPAGDGGGGEGDKPDDKPEEDEEEVSEEDAAAGLGALFG